MTPLTSLAPPTADAVGFTDIDAARVLALVLWSIGAAVPLGLCLPWVWSKVPGLWAKARKRLVGWWRGRGRRNADRDRRLRQAAVLCYEIAEQARRARMNAQAGIDHALAGYHVTIDIAGLERTSRRLERRAVCALHELHRAGVAVPMSPDWKDGTWGEMAVDDEDPGAEGGGGQGGAG